MKEYREYRMMNNEEKANRNEENCRAGHGPMHCGHHAHGPMNHGQYGHGPMHCGQYGHGPMNHGRYGHGPMNHGQYCYGPMNHGHHAHGPMNHGQYCYGPMHCGHHAHGPMNHGQFGCGPMNHGQYAHGPMHCGWYGYRPMHCAPMAGGMMMHCAPFGGWRYAAFDPFREFERMERAFFGGCCGSRPYHKAHRFMPKTNIRETDDAFILETELPGFNREEIRVDVTGSCLTICAGRKPGETEKCAESAKTGDANAENTAAESESAESANAENADSETANADNGRPVHCGRACRFYRRSFTMRGIREDGIDASFENGVLRLVLPKKTENKPASRSLEIR